MRIAVLTTQCPFVIGGAELHAANLVRELNARGHRAEIVSLPSIGTRQYILDEMLAARALDVSNFAGTKIDLAIGLKFPAYLMRHPRKVFWILHQYRYAYDLWDNGVSDLLEDDFGKVIRDAIADADTVEIGAAERVFANSRNVADRLMRYNGVPSTPLYHPPPLAGQLKPGAFGDYFYFPSRLSSLKRQGFVLEALALARRDVRVVFSGAGDNIRNEIELREKAERLGVADRVEWRGFVSPQEMIDLYAGARGVIFPPLDEDLGYITLEAMLAEKPVVTLTDAGEPAALVRDGLEGLVTKPDPEAFARALERLSTDTELARAMGQAGRARYRDLDVSWDRAIDSLLDGVPSGAPARVVTPEELLATVEGPKEMPAPSLRERMAPPAAAAPLCSMEELAAEYEFGDGAKRADFYFASHWTRYMETLRLVRRAQARPVNVLEIGASDPYVFTALLHREFPNATFTAVQQERGAASTRVTCKVEARGDLSIALRSLNVESEPLPLPDESQDLVVVMEVLEHLAVDPLFMFREMARVTRPGGLCVVTTPNLVSVYGLDRALVGQSPYSFGVFVPTQGAYGRHNREYAPREVSRLAASAGFAKTILETRDVYPHGEPTEALLAHLAAIGDDSRLRGQNIMYVGMRESSDVERGYPADLYPADPRQLSARIGLFREDDIARLVLRNDGPVAWKATGPDKVNLVVDRIDQEGRRTPGVLRVDLPGDIGPGETREVRLRVIEGSRRALGWFEIDLCLEWLGRFGGAGRCRPAQIMAEALEGPVG